MSFDRAINTTSDLSTIAAPMDIIRPKALPTSGNAFDKLRDALAEVRGEATLQPGVENLLSEGMSKEDYINFLYNVYHVVWHFCPVLAAAAARCSDDLKDLRYAIYDHIDDEKGHEDWVLDDIAHMGGDVDLARNGSPAVPIQALIGYNFNAAMRMNPWAAMGMVHVLEETAVSYAVRTAKVTAERLGVDDYSKGFRFLTSHGEMDSDHVAGFEKLVNDYADDEAVAAIAEAGRVNYALFYCLFRDF